RNINLRIVWALIQMGSFNLAINISSKDMRSMPSGSIGWYFMAHYKIKALIYNREFETSVDLIKALIENQGFAKIATNYKELFYIALGYIHLIVDAGLVGDREKYHRKLPEFRIGKFMNTTTVLR